MGGICVQIRFDGSEGARADVEAMAAAAPYRGIDGARTWTGEGAALCAQRTHLLPEDAADPQPLVQDGLVLVADARIDNRQELATDLLRSGFLPDAETAPDAEVVLAAYRLWGRTCAARLVGDFAFVVWDSRRRQLFGVRDPMGMRALHYRWEPRRRLLLATEVKQVLAASDVPREPHEAAVATTLAGPYLPADWTLYAGVAALPAGHVLEADERGCRTRLAWRPDAAARFDGDEQSAAEALRDALASSVRARLRSARPVGIWLSGGLDSGSVASLAGWLREQGQVPGDIELRSYSWAFEELIDGDERQVSDHVVARYGLEATDVPADEGWPLSGYPEHGPDEDDAFLWTYQALFDRTMDRCRDEGVGLLLSGDRGDELSGDRVFDELGLLRAGRVRLALADLLAADRDPLRAARRVVAGPLLRATLPVVADRRQDRALGPPPPWVDRDLAARTGLRDLMAAARSVPSFGGPARSLRYAAVFSPQSVRIAVLRERSRARRAIGYADPYSDRRLVELVLSLPQWMVQRRTEPKKLARRAMVGVMPEAARTAARKTIPYGLFDRGLRERGVPVVEQLMTESRAAARGWLDVGAFRAEHRRLVSSGDSVHDPWWPLSVEMWLRRWWE